jgi:hypothetical protein
VAYKSVICKPKSLIRSTLFLLLGCAVFGQARPNDSLPAKLQAINQALSEGDYSAAAELREEARRRLESLSVDTPEFGGWAQSVARLYSSGARTAQARAILKSALDRTGILPASSQVRIDLLTNIADLWRQDRNLLKAAEYLRKAVSAQEMAPPRAAANPPVSMAVFSSGVQSRGVRFYSGPEATLKNLYRQLAELEQQLGHPEAAAGWNSKLRALSSKGGPEELASFLEQAGQLAEAAAVRTSAVERATSPDEEAAQLQRLAGLYQRLERVDDAVAAQQQAIARMEASGSDLRNQAAGARQALARIYQQAGKLQQADAVYLDLFAQAPADQQVRLVTDFSNYLISTQRAAQALAVLNEFRGRGGPLHPWEEASFYYTMANAARASGNNEQAEEYQARGRALSQEASPRVAPPVSPQIDTLLQKAQEAATTGNTDEAFGLAMRAIDAASRAPNRDQIGWTIPSIVVTMTNRKASAKADQLYGYAVTTAESWAGESLQPLLNLLSNRTHYLIGLPDRAAEAADSIERYRAVLTEAHGADSGTLDDPMRMAVLFERTRHPAPASLIPVQDLLAYEEAINGNTSEPYLRALQTLAESYDYNSDRRQAIQVRRQIVQLADDIYPAGDFQRAQARVTLAMALANEGEFDEAENIAADAIAQTRGHEFDHGLQQIREMRAARERTRNLQAQGQR